MRLQDRQFVVQRCGARRQLRAPCRARTPLGEALQVKVEALQVELERDRRHALAAVVPKHPALEKIDLRKNKISADALKTVAQKLEAAKAARAAAKEEADAAAAAAKAQAAAAAKAKAQARAAEAAKARGAVLAAKVAAANAVGAAESPASAAA